MNGDMVVGFAGGLLTGAVIVSVAVDAAIKARDDVARRAQRMADDNQCARTAQRHPANTRGE